MKVLALNSSPRSDSQSKTELMMLQLVKGMTEAGASVEVINLREKRIRNCTGCFTCWTRTPGVCVLKDDMTSELFPKWLNSDIGNLMWKNCIAEGLTPEALDKKGLVLRPDSIETFMIIMKMGFNASAAADARAVIEFRFSQEREGACHFTIADGRFAASLGYAEKADLIIESPFELWMDIMTGKKDGQQSFFDNQYRVQGDFSLLMRLAQIFGKKTGSRDTDLRQ